MEKGRNADKLIDKKKEPPQIILDKSRNKEFIRGRFLGKGGFARCYELSDKKNGDKFAGKVIYKAVLVKESQKEKMKQEICIHRMLNHENVVGFHGYFEDADFIYILLELCNRRSLLELHKRRSSISELEARYFITQIVHGCQYLHKNRIIHRDLKLANLFLDNNLVIKIGDFGLASRIGYEGEKKRTLCGTPNYIAPEILSKCGHSFEVDSWSLGCILYTLLVGRPPFETHELEETYKRIKQNEYSIPVQISSDAKSLIKLLLHANPKERPNMFNILNHEFFKDYIPSCLPISCLTTCPRFDTLETLSCQYKLISEPSMNEDVLLTSGGGGINVVNTAAGSDDCWLSELHTRLVRVLKEASVHSENLPKYMEDSEDPAACPIYWVSRWVDYSDKYGLGYQLCDNSCGVVFNDITRLLLTANEDNLQYIDEDGKEHLYTLTQYPETLGKKVNLLSCFRIYMSENLVKTGENVERVEAEKMTRLPFLRKWFRNRLVIVLHLSNGTVQINFLKDHVKIILCPLMRAITYVDGRHSFTTYRFKLLRTVGLTPDLADRLRYAVTMIERLRYSSTLCSRTQSNETKSKSNQLPLTDVNQMPFVVEKAAPTGTAAATKGFAAVNRPTRK